MVSRSGDLEVERSGLEVQKQITVEVEVTRLFVPQRSLALAKRRNILNINLRFKG